MVNLTQMFTNIYKTKYGSRVVVFIHYVYGATNKNVVNYSTASTRQTFEIFKNQIPYFTGVDLGVQFYKLGLISKENLLKVATESLQNIDPIYYNNVKMKLTILQNIVIIIHLDTTKTILSNLDDRLQRIYVFRVE